MLVPFRKMHGAGNDFVIIDARATSRPLSPTRIAALSDRHTGIGCDQFITLENTQNADIFMRIHNSDGSQSGTCGNATRCVAALLHEESGHDTYLIETNAGLLPAFIGQNDITIDMGPPHLRWSDIPLAHEADTLRLPLEGSPAAVSMGNPHATFFVPDLDQADIARQGAALQHHPIFPHGANIGFAQILSPTAIRLRVWERGTGLTRACGSGACATLVNAVRRELAARRADLLLDGGTLTIEWRDDNHVLMTGPTAEAFQGSVDLSTYPA